MPAVIIDSESAEDPRDVVHRAVEALSAGRIVAIPTETVYGLAASALNPAAVKRLVEIKGRASDKPLAFAIKSVDDALDYVPKMSDLARRVARRSWPGPITLVLDADHHDSVLHRLDESVRKATIPNGTVGLRVPAHELTLQIMRLCAGPIVLTSANLSGQPESITAQQVAESLGDKIDLIIDDGPCKFGKPTSVVQIRGDEVKILREGLVDAKTIQRLTNFIALVVCTGNTCRSPMGEGLLEKRIAERLGCNVESLDQKGVSVISAGIAAMPGSPPSEQAVEVMNRMGVDIADHSSQPITGRLAQFADIILTMTNGHRQALISHWPTLETRTRTVRRDGADVNDPIGCPVEVYQSTAQQMMKIWRNGSKSLTFQSFNKFPVQIASPASMKVSIGSDHRGLQQRKVIAETIEALGHEVDDQGAFTDEPCDYPDVAETVANQVASDKSDLGILVCGTGIGMSIAANKVDGVRAALCCNVEAAKLSRQHNDANVLCLSGSDFDASQYQAVVTAWLNSEFEGGRHARRLEKVRQLESK